MRSLILGLFLSALLSACQSAPTRTIDSTAPMSSAAISEVTPADALPATSAAYSQFIDVRTPEEYAAGHADRARNIPLDQLAANLDVLEKNEPVYLICRTDNRSTQAAKILVDAGFKRAIVIKGGTEAWKAAGLPMGTTATTAPASKLDDKSRQALMSALEDERRAYANYEAALAKFPDARPFSNIVGAEKRHEALLLPLFSKYGVPVPPNEYDSTKLDVPASINDACAAAVEAEKANIALYDGFLSFVKEPDIREVFLRLQAASRDNHLPAFTRCGVGGGSKGRGPGPGRPS